jgi:hypothetical protein
MLKYSFPVAAGLVLLLGVGFQVYAATRPVATPPLRPPLDDILPASIAGWTVTDLGLGATESVTERSHGLLRLDDFVHRAYTRDGAGFSVFVAWWKPGKMPVRLVNQHTPDRCWTEVGWVCDDRRWNVSKEVAGRPLQPAQWGVYRHGDFVQNTYFWHIVGERAHWYGGERLNTRTSVRTIFTDLLSLGQGRNKEQFFVRIVATDSLDALWEDPAMQQVLLTLADLCLAEPEES